jgi:hypothetical protein
MAGIIPYLGELKLLSDPVPIRLKNLGMTGIGLAIIHIDRIEFTEHGQGTIGSDGLGEGFMALLLRELSHVLVSEFNQEALFEGSDTTGCLFIVFVAPGEHSDQGADFDLRYFLVL